MAEVMNHGRMDAFSHSPWSIYTAHALSTWGDNMWWFAGGCFIMELHKDSLRLTATYGMVIAASVILFGAYVGRWIDKTGRLTVQLSVI